MTRDPVCGMTPERRPRFLARGHSRSALRTWRLDCRLHWKVWPDSVAWRAFTRTSPSSSLAQDPRFSIWKHGFESRRGHQP